MTSLGKYNPENTKIDKNVQAYSYVALYRRREREEQA